MSFCKVCFMKSLKKKVGIRSLINRHPSNFFDPEFVSARSTGETSNDARYTFSQEFDSTRFSTLIIEFRQGTLNLTGHFSSITSTVNLSIMGMSTCFLDGKIDSQFSMPKYLKRPCLFLNPPSIRVFSSPDVGFSLAYKHRAKSSSSNVEIEVCQNYVGKVDKSDAKGIDKSEVVSYPSVRAEKFYSATFNLDSLLLHDKIAGNFSTIILWSD